MIRVIVLVVAGCLAACATTYSSRCSDPHSEDCLLSLAEASLRDTMGPVDWVGAAGGLALGLCAADRKDSARAVLAEAQSRLSEIGEPTDRIDASLELSKAFRQCLVFDQARRLAQDSQGLTNTLEHDDTRWDRLGNVAAELAAMGDIAAALDIATSMSEVSPNQASFKARTLGNIAVHQAEHARFRDAGRTLANITMGLVYYRATARTRIANLAPFERTSEEFAAEAERLARGQDNGYFSAGALRQVAAFEFGRGNKEKALKLFQEAAGLAGTAATPQERARATSRVATTLADYEQYESAAELVRRAELLAHHEASEHLRHWAYYEIAGAAAFAGDFQRALRLLDAIPASTRFGGKSVKSAAQRDVVWGLARHGRTEQALELAQRIVSPRERVQAYARVVRLLRTPQMPAHPRYL